MDSNCWYGHSLRTLNQEERVDWMARRTHAPLSPQGSLSVLRGREGRAALRRLFSAVLARGLRAEIPLFFYGAETAAAKALLFFRESATIDSLTIRSVGTSCTQNWRATGIAPASRKQRIYFSTNAQKRVLSVRTRIFAKIFYGKSDSRVPICPRGYRLVCSCQLIDTILRKV